MRACIRKMIQTRIFVMAEDIGTDELRFNI